MKKITFSALLTLFMTFGFAQDPQYNYSIELVGISGTTETYQIVVTTTEAVPSMDADFIDNLQVLIGWDDATLTTPALIGSDFGNNADYFTPPVVTAATVNSCCGGSNTKDIWQVSYSYSGGAVPTHPNLVFLLRQFTVERVSGSGMPEILSNTDPDVAFVNGLGPFGLQNSVVVDNGGVLEERFNPNLMPATLSNESNFDFDAIEFSAYPIPSSGTIYVRNPSIKDFNYEIIDIAGKVVKPIGTLYGRLDNTLELGDLDGGVYFLNVQYGDNQQKSIKIILN